jgi:hypothetical protein
MLISADEEQPDAVYMTVYDCDPIDGDTLTAATLPAAGVIAAVGDH